MKCYFVQHANAPEVAGDRYFAEFEICGEPYLPRVGEYVYVHGGSYVVVAVFHGVIGHGGPVVRVK